MDVLIVLGSESDIHVAERVKRVLDLEKISYKVEVASAHRDVEKLDELLLKTKCKIFIAIAGLSAQLPGYIASRTEKPVIGVPVSSSLLGIDSLLSIVQMPKGIPVACVGIDNGENAAYLALRILKIGE
ncbi:MAG: AIR carboxylase family protein [Candidatus Methanofastidiosia archaeon]